VRTIKTRDHGGGLDAVIARFGGRKIDWIDLSTGINPVPYPVADLTPGCWASLPDKAASDRLLSAARKLWDIPDDAAVLAAPGTSSLIARIPGLVSAGTVQIPGPTYNEHQAAFIAHDWQIADSDADALVIVHPNNPDGRFWAPNPAPNKLTIIDESFCDIAPQRSLVNLTARPGTLILKSFGKFWGLAGLRLGFAIGEPELVAKLATALGPWPVSGPALAIGAAALADLLWAEQTRARLAKDAARLDGLMTKNGAKLAGGTPLFRLYDVDSATAWQDRLARHNIWSRIFPYSDSWLRLGLPAPHQWARLEAAL